MAAAIKTGFPQRRDCPFTAHPAARAPQRPGMRPLQATRPRPMPRCCEELVAKGVPLMGPREAFSDGQGRVRSFYVQDPDGVIIQFDSGLNVG